MEDPAKGKNSGLQSDVFALTTKSETRKAMNRSQMNLPFTLRKMTESDVPAVAILHVSTFNETHTINNDGPSCELRESQWRAAFKESPATWFGVVIENESGELVGFAKGRPHDGSVAGFQGELNKIYLLRRYHRLGLGRRLLCYVARRFIDRGISSMLLFGDAKNPSNGFYEAMGGERIFAPTGEFHGAYGWRNLHELVRFHAPNVGKRAEGDS